MGAYRAGEETVRLLSSRRANTQSGVLPGWRVGHPAPGVDWLDPAAAKEEVEEQDDEDEVNDASTIVAVARTCVVAATADEENEDDEQNDHLGDDAGGVEWGCPGGVV